MPEVAVVNAEGVEIGKVALSSEVFEVQPHVALMHRAVVSHLANLRTGTADTQTRGEVRGGGRKPFRQKGTGRARQGSSRSPMYPGGGVAFGPHPRDYSVQLPKKMKQLAIKSALASKLADGQLMVVDDLTLDAISTKALVLKLRNLVTDGKVLLAIGQSDEKIKLSARNAPWVTLRVAPSVSTYDLLHADTVIFTQAGLAKMEEAHKK